MFIRSYLKQVIGLKTKQDGRPVLSFLLFIIYTVSI